MDGDRGDEGNDELTCVRSDKSNKSWWCAGRRSFLGSRFQRQVSRVGKDYATWLCIVRCYSFDPSVAWTGAVGGRRWVGVERVTCVGGGA